MTRREFRARDRMSANLKTLQAHAKTALKPAVQGQLSPAERIALYKRFLKIEEHRIKLRHRAGAGGLEPAERPVKVSDLHATICHALGIDLDKEVITAQGQPMRLVWKEASPIRELSG